MFTSPIQHKKRGPESVPVPAPLVGHLNATTLAFLLFLAWALLTTIRGNDLESLDYRPEISRGSLTVYSATDAFDDGGVPYNAHSSYVILTTAGKFFKNVENHLSRSDEIPEVVALPVGSYVIEARSGTKGYIRVPVFIKAGRRTILDLDSRHKESLTQLAHN